MAACYDDGANGNHHIQEATCIKSCPHFTIIHNMLNYLNIFSIHLDIPGSKKKQKM